MVAGLLAAVGIGAGAARAQRAADMPLDSPPQLGRRSQLGVNNMSVATDRAGSATANFGMLSIDRPTPRSTAIAERALVLASLHGDNLASIDMGRIAAQKGQSSDARELGVRLIRERQAADAALMALAAKRGVDAAALYAASPASRQDRDQIDRLGGLPEQVIDHEVASAVEQRAIGAIETAQGARETTNDAELRALLGQMLPTLEAQLLGAQGLLSR
jgi:predicted outer membrane protein